MMRRREALAPLDQVVETARELGDQESSYYARFVNSVYLALAGDPVVGAEGRLRELAESAARAGHWFPEPDHCHRIYRLLLVDRSAVDLERKVAESDARLASQPGTAEPYARTLWQLVLCVHGRYDLAFAQSEVLGDRVFRLAPSVHVADHFFYRGLAAGVLAASVAGSARRRYARAVREAVRRLRLWSKAGPDFGHMALLVHAEEVRLRRRVVSALQLYERASPGSQTAGVPAPCCARARTPASLLREARREVESASAERQAHSLYREWGAARSGPSSAEHAR